MRNAKLTQVKYFTKKHGVDGEISALCILLPVSGKLHLCVPPIGLYIHSQSGHFKVLIMKLYNVEIRMFQFAFIMLTLCGKLSPIKTDHLNPLQDLKNMA